MPTVSNPSKDRLEVHVSDRTFYIDPGKTADVDDDEATELEGHPVLKVQSSAPKPDTSAAKPQEERKS